MELDLYRCHRKFIDSYLSLHKLSLKSLSLHTNKAVSTATLSRIVKKDRSGNYEKAFNIGLDSWTHLISNMKLTKEEALQAILLRVKDEISTIDTKLMKDTKRLFRKMYDGISEKEVDQSNFSPEALQIGQTYDKLPKRFQKSVATETYKVIGYLDDLSPATAETLKKNKKAMRRIFNN